MFYAAAMKSEYFAVVIIAVVATVFVIIMSTTIHVNLIPYLALAQQSSPEMQDSEKSIDNSIFVNESDNSSAINMMKTNISNFFDNVNYLSISNATSPAVAVDSKGGTIYLSFTRTENNVTNIYMTKSSDDGVSFSKPVRINHVIGDASPDAWTAPRILLGNTGEIFVIWHVIDESNKEFAYGASSLRLARSLDGGQSFEPTIYPANDTVTEKAFFGAAISPSDGRIYISYLDNLSNITDFTISYPSKLNVIQSSDSGKTFDSSSTIDPTACDCCRTAITVGPDGEAYMAWRHASHDTAETYSNGSNPFNYDDKLEEGVIYQVVRDVFVAHSIDDGLISNLSPPVKVQDDSWLMNGCPSAGPSLSFDPNGRLHVTWFTGGGEMPGTYYAFSDDRGQSFSTPLPVLTDEWIPPADSNLAIDSQNNIWITTADKRNENHTNIFVGIVNPAGSLTANNAFAESACTLTASNGCSPVISSGANKTAIGWTEGSNLNLAVANNDLSI